MTTIQAVSGRFDFWLARFWQDRLRRNDAAEREREHRRSLDVAQALRERIAQYEPQQPGYASDLRAALARMEVDTEQR
jgi:hypothetical protein